MPCSDQMIESKRKRKAGALASEKVCGVESFFKRVKAVKGEAAEKKQRPHGTKVTAVSFAPKLTSVFLTYSPLEYNRTPPELDIFSCDSCSCTILGERHHCGVCDYDLCVLTRNYDSSLVHVVVMCRAAVYWVETYNFDQ